MYPRKSWRGQPGRKARPRRKIGGCPPKRLGMRRTHIVIALLGAIGFAGGGCRPGAGTLAATPQEPKMTRDKWLEQALAPLRSEDLETFRKECMLIAPPEGGGGKFGGRPSWTPDYMDWSGLQDETSKVLRERLRKPPLDTRFLVYALTAARAFPTYEFVDEAVPLLQAESSEVRGAAIGLLMPWPGHETPKEREPERFLKRPAYKVRILEALFPSLEGKEGGSKLLAHRAMEWLLGRLQAD